MGRIKNFQIDPDKILDCVYVVLSERGLGGLTLDATAAAAGISKGGLIHHFPTKRALLDAVVRREAGLLARDFHSRLERQPAGPGRKCRAFLEVFAELFDPALDPGWAKTDMAIYAASLEDPELVRPFSKVMMTLADDLEDDGVPASMARLLVASVVGLYHEAALPITFSRRRGREIFQSLGDFLDRETGRTPASPARHRRALVSRNP